MWINPNLTVSEASQPTNIALWRSGYNSAQGVTFNTDMDTAALALTNIAIYTGDDTPCDTAVPEPASLMSGLVGLTLVIARRRK